MPLNTPREFNVVVERDAEGYYIASVPSLPGCHTQARSLDELIDRIKEAIELCLEVNGGATIGPGLASKILRDCDLTADQLRSLL